ncbi:MAG: hypothetical protein V4568_12525 [Pseudomonadota bacterium]
MTTSFLSSVEAVKAEINKVVATHPYLGAYGWKHKGDDKIFEESRRQMLSDDFAIQVTAAIMFIKRQCKALSDNYGYYSSYCLKHKAEHFYRTVEDLEIYISNGALITAAIILSIPATAIRNTPNCTIQVELTKEGEQWPSM